MPRRAVPLMCSILRTRARSARTMSSLWTELSRRHSRSRNGAQPIRITCPLLCTPAVSYESDKRSQNTPVVPTPLVSLTSDRSRAAAGHYGLQASVAWRSSGAGAWRQLLRSGPPAERRGSVARAGPRRKRCTRRCGGRRKDYAVPRGITLASAVAIRFRARVPFSVERLRRSIRIAAAFGLEAFDQ